jgi:L,D-peptidoglycan transpeptidase YkuD (ErfK/YbiS/YcfS/YnhG family)
VRKTITRIHAAAISARSSRGALLLGCLCIPCLFGRNGRTSMKREGDGKTPRGAHALVGLRYRPDRLMRPAAGQPMTPLRASDGWCDASGDRNYNRPVALPCAASHEVMWRGDSAYDIVGILDWNLKPRRRGCGSAIFFHIAAPGSEGTAGCIAIAPAAMRRLLPMLGRKAVFVVR